MANEIPVTWDTYRRIKRKDPRGLRTWHFAIHRAGKAASRVISFNGNFPKARDYAQAAVAQVIDAVECVVLLP